MALPYQPMAPRTRIGLAIALSLLAHAFVLPWVAKDWVFKVPHKTAVSLVNGSRGKAAGGRATRSDTPTPARANNQPKTPEELAAEEARRKQQEKEVAQEAPKPVPVKPVRIDGQLVSLGPPKDERPPVEPTRYLSEHDSRVLKETRARETSAFFKNALSKVQKEGKQERVEDPARHSATPQKPEEKPQGISQAPLHVGGGAIPRAPAAELPKRERQDRLQLQQAEDGTVQARVANDPLAGSGKKLAMARPSDARVEPSTGFGAGPGAPGSLPGLPGGKFPQLKLTLDNPLDALGPIAGGPMPDHLAGVEEGEETLLNSRSFRYAGYLNRVKEAVGRIWTSDVQEIAQRRDPTGQTYSYKDRRTVVEFTLDKAGDIKDVKVQASSGVDYLDRVAVEAFKKAERFPNPPPGLLGEQGVVTLPFAFTLMAATGGARIIVGPGYLPPAQRGY